MFQEKVEKTHQKLVLSKPVSAASEMTFFGSFLKLFWQRKLLIYAYYLGELLQSAPSLAEELLAAQNILAYYKRTSIHAYDFLPYMVLNQTRLKAEDFAFLIGK
ncbi:9184_t:CDS:2 [Gigaspora rosea]|nr:9184_t:CDS:2 [Gigaspora rosea]